MASHSRPIPIGPLQWFLLIAAVALALFLSRPDKYRIKWNDETLYYTVATNIARHGDFNSHHYIADSILKKGYPTKDTHTPGFPMLIAAGFLLGGVGEKVPFVVNHVLTFLASILLFLLGRKLANGWVGFAAVLLFLLFPFTLPLAQAIMSEPAAALAAVLIAYLLFTRPEGIAKGILLSLAISFALLVKPFLGIFLPVVALFLWLRRDRGGLKTLLYLAIAMAILLPIVVLPLTSNREYYPYAATEILAQPDWKGKALKTWANLKKNWALLSGIQWKTTDGKTTLGILLMWVLAFVGWGASLVSRPGTDKLVEARGRSYSELFGFTLISFLGVAGAVFLLYEYIAFRGSRAICCFSPLLALLSAMALERLGRLKWPFVTAPAVLIYLALAGFFLKALITTTRDFRASQGRQSSGMIYNYARLVAAIAKIGAKPSRVLSLHNFYFPIGHWPAEVVWSLPRNRQELLTIDAKAPLDLLEFREKDAVIQESILQYGNWDTLGEKFQLVHRNAGFLYYVPITPNQKSSPIPP